MKALELSPKARNDLEDIWLFSFSEWGLAQADAYVASLRSVIKGLQDGQTVSRRADGAKPGYHLAVAARHLVVFRQTPDKIIVIRVLHQRMDVDRLI
ncbi:plasmid stabilization system [Roseobacter sp. AzwK-3b]|uniref:type II toxin-antitoxin system RelE/ParE family toxin n=1 Tax=Roseobacter sp. AzwK-3b TaxID=351016 RepID=UPI000156930D|nr:type II toxin-antitoxin system RelE/ParE family toxin [Roseobacter sp. AzwK-3b]EDM72949.1 plasmid stabilization system [Roseobacter sp. AzwK-3b]